MKDAQVDPSASGAAIVHLQRTLKSPGAASSHHAVFHTRNLTS